MTKTQKIRKLYSDSGTRGFDLKAYLKQCRQRVDSALDQWLPPADHFPATLHAAIRHSLFSGGKRLRPILLLAATEACGGRIDYALPAACAVECVHTYSLIHDDLPSLDNDDFRRGRPTCHKVYGEAAALLAGDALLTLAFEILSQIRLRPRALGSICVLQAIQVLAHAGGMAGMVGGQMADVEAEGKEVELPLLQYIHTHKTGYLIQAAVILGGLLAPASSAQLKALSRYGENLGLAFQIIDDVLNVVGETKKLGKQTGTDAARGKATYPALFGVEESQRQAQHLLERGCRALKIFGRQAAEPLKQLAQYMVIREV